MNRKTGFSRLWELAGKRKLLLIVSVSFSVLSAFLTFVPFIAVYFIIKNIITSGVGTPVDTAFIFKMGILSLAGIISSIAFNTISLAFSHVAAFNILFDLKLNFAKHLSSLPLGYHTSTSTGKLRKIVDVNIEKIEGFLAHTVPDTAATFAAPVFMIILMFVFDWRFGLAAVLPLVLAFIIQMRAFKTGGENNLLKKYQDSLEDMNTCAVEYVRGISVVKAFNQTLYSYKKFYETIKSFTDFVLNWTMSVKKYYNMYLTLINNVYLFLIPVAILLFSKAGNFDKIAFSFLFYLIFVPSVAGLFTKLINVASNSRMIIESVERIGY